MGPLGQPDFSVQAGQDGCLDFYIKAGGQGGWTPQPFTSAVIFQSLPKSAHMQKTAAHSRGQAARNFNSEM